MFVGFPFIEERFSDSASRITLSWVVTALFIFMVSSLLVAGRVADRFGRRKIFLSGLLLYGAAGIMAGSIPVIWVFNSRTLSSRDSDRYAIPKRTCHEP